MLSIGVSFFLFNGSVQSLLNNFIEIFFKLYIFKIYNLMFFQLDVFTYTIDPWTTGVWIAQVHFYLSSFQKKYWKNFWRIVTVFFKLADKMCSLDILKNFKKKLGILWMHATLFITTTKYIQSYYKSQNVLKLMHTNTCHTWHHQLH